jgi:murein DD-endopeptidase MepM/ murein hydrolase activator NlpD
MRPLLAVLLVVLAVATTVVWWFKFEHFAPQVSLVAPLTDLGRGTPFDIDVHTDAPGLRSTSVRLTANGTTFELLSSTYPAGTWTSNASTDTRVHVDADLVERKVPEGAATIEVFVDTYAWHLWEPPREPILSVPVTVDLTPPKVELLTTQHNIRLGGVDLVVFRQSPDTTRSGIEVDKYFFPTITNYFTDRSVVLAFFAVPQDLSAAVHPRLVASDAAGNRREVALPCTIKPRQFAERTLPIDDDFLTRKVPDLEHENDLPPTPDLVAGYLTINRDLRQRNEAQIRELTARPRSEPLWDGVFHRQSNAAPLSSFADRRTYTYHGEVIDHQTHLGYDLASLKLSPVEAAQNGIVIFAGNLGIYGNAVLLDHGMGIFSLYGHLSTIAVQPGVRVTTAQPIGQTGETGLAGGDHLHFSILLDGVHVDPVEWWDAHWLHDHVTPKLMMFPRNPSDVAAHSDQPCPEPRRRGERAIEGTPAVGPAGP